VTGSLSLGGYDGLALTLLGSHVYVAESLSGGNTQNMVAIDTNAMQVIGTLSLEATAMHFDMAGFGSTVLIGQNTMLFVVDVSNPMSPVSIGTGYSAGGVIEDLVVNSPKNTLVFLGTNSQEKEFQVVSLASLASPVIYSWYNVTGESTVGGVLYDPIRDLVYSDVTSTAEEFVIFSPYF
jgi:DNA-binding beta-propeller fold protein YncE